MIGTEDVKRLADFYEQVIGKKADTQDGDYYGWNAGSTFLSVGPHDKIHGKSKDPDRILLNFETNEVKEEFERISKIEGVTVVKEPYTMEGYPDFWIATLADPDGNYFQLMPPWEG